MYRASQQSICFPFWHFLRSSRVSSFILYSCLLFKICGGGVVRFYVSYVLFKPNAYCPSPTVQHIPCCVFYISVHKYHLGHYVFVWQLAVLNFKFITVLLPQHWEWFLNNSVTLTRYRHTPWWWSVKIETCRSNFMYFYMF